MKAVIDPQMSPGDLPASADFINFCPRIFVVRPFAPHDGNATLGLGGLRGLASVSNRHLPLEARQILANNALLHYNFSAADKVRESAGVMCRTQNEHSI
ncbi:MAG: hypothetical protein WC378_09155 [Opitutaceae bacterium]